MLEVSLLWWYLTCGLITLNMCVRDRYAQSHLRMSTGCFKIYTFFSTITFIFSLSSHPKGWTTSHVIAWATTGLFLCRDLGFTRPHISPLASKTSDLNWDWFDQMLSQASNGLFTWDRNRKWGNPGFLASHSGKNICSSHCVPGSRFCCVPPYWAPWSDRRAPYSCLLGLLLLYTVSLALKKIINIYKIYTLAHCCSKDRDITLPIQRWTDTSYGQEVVNGMLNCRGDGFPLYQNKSWQFVCYRPMVLLALEDQTPDKNWGGVKNPSRFFFFFFHHLCPCWGCVLLLSVLVTLANTTFSQLLEQESRENVSGRTPVKAAFSTIRTGSVEKSLPWWTRKYKTTTWKEFLPLPNLSKALFKKKKKGWLDWSSVSEMTCMRP